MIIRYYGHNGLLTGFGRAADEMVEALAAAGAELEVRPLAPPPTWNHNAAVSRFFREDDDLCARPDAIICHTLPLSLAQLRAEVTNLPELADVPVIAYTTWEAIDAPDAIHQALDGFHQIWVPSRATQSALQQDPPRPIRIMPHAYDDTIDRVYTGHRDEAPFTFYYIGAWSARKNPAGLIRAFCSEFDRSEDVRLLLQCRGVPRETFIGAMFATGLDQSEWPKITFSNMERSENELWAIHANADVFVTATRGEAWNLPAFEAVLAGRHVISPGMLGSDDFLEDTSAALVAGTLAPAYVDVKAAPGPVQGSINLHTVGAQGLSCRSVWREPDLSALALKMREAYQLGRRTLECDYDLARSFGRKAVGQLALDFLKEISSR